jgi:hypothetical protein
LDPVKWALNTTYHTTLQALTGQFTFGREMILPTSCFTYWEILCQQRQHATDANTIRENASRICHHYCIKDRVLIVHTADSGKLACPTSGPFSITANKNQIINGAVTIRCTPSTTKTINIRQLRPYRAVEDANA